MYTRNIFLAATLIALCFARAFADTPVLPAPMTLKDGRLTGDGAEILRAELPDAQFILIGEDHGFADPPEIALALAQEARAFGVTHHVLEIGPRTDTLLTDILRTGNETDLSAFLTGRPLAIPFANMAEDARLADYFVDGSEPGDDPLWGVDQEFIGATLIYLESLAEMASTPEATALVRARLEAEKAAFETGDLGALWLLSALPADFRELEAAFQSEPEALAIIRELEGSAEIYGLYSTGKNYASNAARVALIRRQFLNAYRASGETAPRALFKMGASHLAKGTGPLNTFDLGSLTEGLAAANGLKALRIVIVPLGGLQTTTNPAAQGVFETADFRSEDIAAVLSAAGISEAAIPVDGYAVVPLNDIRTRLEQKGLRDLSADQRFLVLGYDYLITTRASRPATPLAH
jgi:hypothetical protein